MVELIIDTELCEDATCSCVNAKWWTGWVGNTVHVVPVNDTQPHTTRCACGPVRELVVTDNGRHGFGVWNVVHNAYDGRS